MARLRSVVARLRSIRNKWPEALVPSRDLLRLVGLWVAWVAIICGFQILVQARLTPARPDNSLAWTQYETGQLVQDCRPMLADPNMNEHVAFDSEYYLAIAQDGYDSANAVAFAILGDPSLAQFGQVQTFRAVPSCSPGAPETWTSIDYAFQPGYPMAIRAVMTVIKPLPFVSQFAQTDTGLATLSGILVSVLGGLLAMLGLARLMAFLERRRKDQTEPVGPWGGISGLRAACYLLVFPTGFYLAQVYTEGLFVGLAFMACAMAVERKVVYAAIFAALAAITRPAGVFLFFPLAWAAFEIFRDRWVAGDRLNWRLAVAPVLSLAPVATFGLWYMSSLGDKFRYIEDNAFGRRFDIFASIDSVVATWNSFLTGTDRTGSIYYRYFSSVNPGDGSYPALNSQSMFYIGLELFSIALAVAAIVWLLRRAPGVALFGLGVFVLSLGSSAGAPQGMDRYVLAVPAIFLMLAWFGRRALFDRAWVMASTLLMGLSVTLFTFGFWVS